MPDFLKQYVTTEGPLGLPMQDRQAFQLDSILKALPQEDRALRHAVVAKAPTELLDGERADVSWISTEDIDRDGRIVVSRGMNDAHFKLNPLVTLQHAYWRPPVGRSFWRKRVKDGPTVGIKREKRGRESFSDKLWAETTPGLFSPSSPREVPPSGSP